MQNQIKKDKTLPERQKPQQKIDLKDKILTKTF